MARSIIVETIFLISFISSSDTYGFSVDLIHRDSPHSPLYDPDVSPSRRLSLAVDRSLRRARRFVQNKTSVVSMLASGDGEHFMQFHIGTPRRKIIAVADTASGLIWTQCQPCKKCYRQKLPIFNPHLSRTFETVSCGAACEFLQPLSKCEEQSGICTYNKYYNDLDFSRSSNTHGDVAREVFFFVDSRGLWFSFRSLAFGCGHENNFRPGIASGVVGLDTSRFSLVRQLNHSIFSYCLVPYGSPRISRLYFGYLVPTFYGASVVRTPISRENPGNFYYLTLEAISVGAKRLEYPQTLSAGLGNMVIDTGTALTHLDRKFYYRLEDALVAAINTRAVRNLPDWRLCYNEEDYPVFPKMTVHFKGADVEWSTKHAFVIVEDDERYLCFAVVPTTDVSLYGNIAQTDFEVRYDLNRWTVSFIPTLCGD